MSGFEVVAVIGCVAAVVSAYKDGGKIVKQIKAKRQAKKAPAPTEPLEASLERGPVAVGEARDSGIERYGPKFATGDPIATEALRNILIHLQGTLLRHLWVAQEDDGVTDFNILVDASDFGRIQSVTVLNELYMRMAQAAPLQRPLLSEQGGVETLDASSSTSIPWEHNDRVPEITIFQLGLQSSHKTQPDLSPPEQWSPPRLQDNVGSVKSPMSRKKWGLFQSSKSRKNSATTSPPLHRFRSEIDGSKPGAVTSDSTSNNSPLGIDFEDNRPHVPKPASRADQGSPSQIQRRSTNGPIPPLIWKPSPEMIIDEDNPWQSELSTSTPSYPRTAQGSLNQSQTAPRRQAQTRRRSTEKTLVNSNDPATEEVEDIQKTAPHQPRKSFAEETTTFQEGESATGPKAPQWKLPFMPGRRKTLETADHVENPTLRQEHQKSPEEPHVISRVQSSPQTIGSGPRNQYGGFCKGVYKLQVGLEKESVKLRNQSTSMTGQSHYWACASSKCAFEGPALNIGKAWTFDDRVRILNGVRYRWTFLMKSHVALARVKVTGRYDYQCVLCDSKEQPQHTYSSEKGFIRHISTHRGQDLAIWISNNFRCIVDRVAEDSEIFDVNLTPPHDIPPYDD